MVRQAAPKIPDAFAEGKPFCAAMDTVEAAGGLKQAGPGHLVPPGAALQMGSSLQQPHPGALQQIPWLCRAAQTRERGSWDHSATGLRALTLLQRPKETRIPEEITCCLRIAQETSPPKGQGACREEPTQLSMSLHATACASTLASPTLPLPRLARVRPAGPVLWEHLNSMSLKDFSNLIDSVICILCTPARAGLWPAEVSTIVST